MIWINAREANYLECKRDTISSQIHFYTSNARSYAPSVCAYSIWKNRKTFFYKMDTENVDCQCTHCVGGESENTLFCIWNGNKNKDRRKTFEKSINTGCITKLEGGNALTFDHMYHSDNGRIQWHLDILSQVISMYHLGYSHCTLQ